MIESLVTVLRDKNTSMAEFRRVSQLICDLLAARVSKEVNEAETSVITPLKKAHGKKLDENILLVPILRSGIAFLPSFMKMFSSAVVGFIGIRRDEQTAFPHIYYENLINDCTGFKIIILDPMIATGGSTIAAIKRLLNQHANEENILVTSIICSKDGIKAILKAFPKVKVTTAVIDPELDKNKFIIPGLGDFGDRFFGSS